MRGFWVAVLTVACLAIAMPSYADGQKDYLFGLRLPYSGHYGSLGLSQQKILDTPAQSVDFGWQAVYNNSVSFGLAMSGLPTSIKVSHDKGRFSSYSAGLKGTYFYNLGEFFDIGASLTVGQGWLHVRYPGEATKTPENGTFRLIKPGVAATVGLTRHSRLGIGVARTIAKGASLTDVSTDDISGTSFTIEFRTVFFAETYEL